MSDASARPASRTRRRKFWKALAALPLLAAFLMFLFRPARLSTANPVHLKFQSLTTNAAGQSTAAFVASNGWHRQVDLWRASVEVKDGNQWAHRFRRATSSLELRPGETARVTVEVPTIESPWRAEVIWIVHSSRATIQSWNLRAALGRVIPAVAPDPVEWFHRHARTNLWTETVR